MAATRTYRTRIGLLLALTMIGVAAIALSGGLTYISLSDAWGSFASISRRGYLTADRVHPSDRGGEAMAAEVGRVIIKEKLLDRGK